MNTEQAYNCWSLHYDRNENKTRDLEAIALCETQNDIPMAECLEIGCGTGKNTTWLVEKVRHVTAVDFSSNMLAQAKEKIKSDRVEFIQADIAKPWSFANKKYDLITFSLVLEHIEKISNTFFANAKEITKSRRIYLHRRTSSDQTIFGFQGKV